MLLGTTASASDASGSHELDYRPLLAGLVVAGVYWLACRRGIRAAALADADGESAA